MYTLNGYKNYEDKVVKITIDEKYNDNYVRTMTVTENDGITIVNGDVDNPWFVIFNGKLKDIKLFMEKHTDANFWSMHYLGGTYPFKEEYIESFIVSDIISDNTGVDYDITEDVFWKDAVRYWIDVCEDKNIKYDEKEIVDTVQELRSWDDGFIKSIDILKWVVDNVK